MRTAAKTLIVTADDFGLSAKVNEGILEAFHRGVVRNTTVMLNYPDVEASVVCLKQAKGLDVGVHLNLTSGFPVLGPDRVPSLVDHHGEFLGLGSFLVRVAVGRIRWSEVRSEWEAQIERGIKMGCHFSSITSHQHIHMLPQLASLCALLAHKYDISAVRLSRYHLGNIIWPPCVKSFAINPCAAVARRLLNRERVRSNDYVIEIPPAPFKIVMERFRRNLQRFSVGLVELVCHPGYVDSDLKKRDPNIIPRVFELDVLTDPQIPLILMEQSVQLTTYKALAGRKWSHPAN